MQATLHYIHDPLCGWCYGAEPLVNAAASVPNLGIVLHGGGLWPEPTRLPEATRRYIQQADARIAQISGQPFGEAYLSDLLLDESMILESRPTIAAVLAAEAVDPSKGLTMLQAIQHAHYERGDRVVEHDVLCGIAEQCGIDRVAFERALASAATDQHIAETRQLMGQIGAQGFPTFVLRVDSQSFAVPHQQFASDPDGFKAWLSEQCEKQTGICADA